MDLNCVFYGTRDAGDLVPEMTLTLRNGVITGKLLDPRCREMMDDILSRDPLRIDAVAIPKSDTEAWMCGLPYAYHGDYFWARHS